MAASTGGTDQRRTSLRPDEGRSLPRHPTGASHPPRSWRAAGRVTCGHVCPRSSPLAGSARRRLPRPAVGGGCFLRQPLRLYLTQGKNIWLLPGVTSGSGGARPAWSCSPVESSKALLCGGDDGTAGQAGSASPSPFACLYLKGNTSDGAPRAPRPSAKAHSQKGKPSSCALMHGSHGCAEP